MAQCWKEHPEQIPHSIQKRRLNGMSTQARKKLQSQISPDYRYQTMAITYHRPAHTAVVSRKSTRVPVQNLREVGFIPVYSEIQVRVVIKKRLQNGGLEQVALMFESSKGRLTLDCKIMSTPLSPLPSLRLAEALNGSLSMNLLHRRLGHSGEAALQRLPQGNMAIGINVKPGSKVDFCDSCQLGKLGHLIQQWCSIMAHPIHCIWWWWT